MGAFGKSNGRGWKVGVVSSVGTVSAVAAIVVACLPDPERPPTGGGPVGAIPCDGGGPGNFPPANCDPTPNACPSAMDPTCTIDPKCGSTKTCLPMADNSKSSTLDLRIRRLYATAPAKLTDLQKIIIDKGINLPSKLGCGEAGDGAFNWLVRIDKTSKTLTTGGAPPSSDPFGLGYCFYKSTVKGVGAVGPSSAKLNFKSDTLVESDPIDRLNVPIFVGGDVNNVVVLPITKAVVKDVALSTDGNCIGSFNAPALGPSCVDTDPDQCSRWHTGGTIGGYITLEDADHVNVDLLNETLCILLAGVSPKPQDGKCPRDGAGKIQAKGDYCSTSGKAGDCADSFWLSATFAAAAVKINDGSTVAACQGGGGSDAGPGDASTGDASTSDASTSDASTADAGASDAKAD